MEEEALLEPLVSDQEGYDFPLDESLLKELAALDAAESGGGGGCGGAMDGLPPGGHVEDEDVLKMKELIRWVCCVGSRGVYVACCCMRMYPVDVAAAVHARALQAVDVACVCQLGVNVCAWCWGALRQTASRWVACWCVESCNPAHCVSPLHCVCHNMQGEAQGRDSVPGGGGSGQAGGAGGAGRHRVSCL